MNIRRSWRYFLLASLLALSLFHLGAGGCGSGSPPAGIPAPVSNLMSVSNPDALGLVTVTGAPGAVNGGAKVIGSNLDMSSQMPRWFQIFYQVAFAQLEANIESTMAGPDGSFLLRLNAQIGNILRFIQTVDAKVSPPTKILVKGNTVALDASPRGLDIDTKTHRVYVSASRGLDGVVFVLPLEGEAPLLSFPAPDFIFDGIGGISDVGVDATLGNGFVISSPENILINFSLEASAPPVGQNFNSPLAIDVLDEANLGAIGMADTLVSWQLFDTFNNRAACPFLLQSPKGGVRHLVTPLIELQQLEERGPFVVISVSQFEDRFWLASRTQFLSCAADGTSNFITTSQVLLPISAEPQGLATFNSGANAIITNAAGNEVFIVDFPSQTITRTVKVGKEPRGVAVFAQKNRAYVVNSGDNSITSMDLTQFSSITRSGIGLSPSEISLDTELNLAVVLSTFDKSVVIVDLDF